MYILPHEAKQTVSFQYELLASFGVLTGVRVDASKIFGVGAGVLKRGAGAESESEKCDSAQL